jgi:hypothetical protein
MKALPRNLRPVASKAPSGHHQIHSVISVSITPGARASTLRLTVIDRVHFPSRLMFCSGL